MIVSNIHSLFTVQYKYKLSYISKESRRFTSEFLKFLKNLVFTSDNKNIKMTYKYYKLLFRGKKES